MYGVYDAKCPSLYLSPYENKIGGYPDFYEDCELSTAPVCEHCHSSLALLVQIYCPLEVSPYHRLLHVFCCTKPACWSNSKSWLVLRSQSLEDVASLTTGCDQSREREKDKTTPTDWCADADDWGSDEELEHVLPQLEELTLTDCERNKVQPEMGGAEPHLQPEMGGAELQVQCRAKTKYKGPHYASGYVNVLEGSHCMQPEESRAAQLLEQYCLENPTDSLLLAGEESGRPGEKRGKPTRKQDRGKRSSEGGGNSEEYEKASARHGDRTFLKFQKELAKCPEQILRYDWKGKPAVLRSVEQLLHPSQQVCPACGAARVFECQLMPPLVYIIQTELHPKSDPTLEPVEFGTAIIYSCSANCWDKCTKSSNSNFKRECIIVQSESD